MSYCQFAQQIGELRDAALGATLTLVPGFVLKIVHRTIFHAVAHFSASFAEKLGVVVELRT